jgi:hypothetical protein
MPFPRSAPATRLFIALVLVSFSLSGCGGGSGDTSAPEEPFPDVAGVYNVQGGFDELTADEASFVGSLVLNQASRQSGELTGTMSVTATINGDITTAGNVAIQSASVSPGGIVSFELGSIGNGGRWTFSGTASGETISGRHTLTDGSLSFSGDWTATQGTVGSGNLTATVSNSGSSVDPDGYTLVVDGAGSGALNATSPVTVSGLAAGNHAVGLTGVADNCQVQGDNPRLVSISPGVTASVAFVVTCTPPQPGSGSIQLTINTTGPDPDPDGYTATLDGTTPIPVPATGSATFPSVAVGSHTVTLSGVAANCTASGGGSASATVSAGAASQVSFTVTCTAIPPSTGTLRITTSTSGPDPDADGYRFSVDGEQPQPIGVNDQVELPPTPAGTHTVVLSNISANCTADNTTKTATVTTGATATVAFSITCTAMAPTLGSIHVTTNTTGTNPDANGYQFTIDGGAAQAIGATSAATVNNVLVGPHTVALSDVASNCTVNGGSTKSVTVAAGQTAEAAFVINCTAPQPSASRSIVLANPKSIGAGTGSSTITVTVKDPGGELLPGISVTPASSGTGNTITPISATTDQEGKAVFTFSSTVAGNKIITATAGGVILEDTEVITVLMLPSTTEITDISPEPSSSGEDITVTVKVTGEGGGVPTGSVAVFSLLETGGCDNAPLNSDGVATCTFPLSVVDTHSINAVYSGDGQFQDSSDSKNHVVAEP